MTFGNPWSALLAAGIAVPLLLLLYILKLRRQAMRIPSTLLWRQSFEDLQVNVPFQRLRWTSLLALQLLLLATLLMALSEPRLQVGFDPSTRMILIVDRSASMNATLEDGRTRLDAARDAALEIVERMGRGGGASDIMILTFGRTAQVVSGFESNPRVLADAIAAIEPTDETANLDAALQLAGAFAARGEDSTQRPPDVVLLSDGGVGAMDADGRGHRLRSGRFRFVQVVESDLTTPVNNLGIAAFSARRDYEDPSHVLVFARFVNAGLQPVNAVSSLVVDDQDPLLKRLEVPAADALQPGEAAVSYSLDLQEGAVIRLRHNQTDDLSTDDEAVLLMPPPARPRLAIVVGDEGVDPFLFDLLQAMRPQTIDELTADQYEQLRETMATDRTYDLVVFDRVSGHALPGLPSLSMGGVPASIDTLEAPAESRRVLSWNRQHPVMRFVNLDTVVYRDFGALDLPTGSTSLALGREGPIMAVINTRGARHVLVGFALPQSNWPVHVSVTVFLQNVLDYLTLAGSVQSGLVHQPGDAITARVATGATELRVDGPLQRSQPLGDDTTTTLPVLRRSGLYTVQGVLPPHDRLAVSVLSEFESDIRPRSSVTVNATDQAAARLGETVPLELWPWLIGLGVALVVLEWLTYCARLRAMS